MLGFYCLEGTSLDQEEDDDDCSSLTEGIQGSPGFLPFDFPYTALAPRVPRVS